MAAKASYRVIVLFEDKVRAAAKALAEAAALIDCDDEEQFSQAAMKALRLSAAALCSAEDDGAVLVLSRKPVIPQAPAPEEMFDADPR